MLCGFILNAGEAKRTKPFTGLVLLRELVRDFYADLPHKLPPTACQAAETL